jgi:hypothetical protein
MPMSVNVSRAWVLCALVTTATAVGVPVAIAGQGASAGPASPKAKDDDAKGKDKAANGNGNGNATGGNGNGNNGNGNGNGGSSPSATTPAAAPTSSAPASSTTPAPTTVAATPLSSVAPTVALDTPSLIPTLGLSVGVAAARGTVIVRTAGGRELHALAADAAAIPTGARVDARQGTVELSTAIDATGTPQTATFSGAIFEVRQDPAANGLTRLILRGGDFSGCRGIQRAAKKRTPVRSLWGQDDHGRFQTRGKGAVGTVRGTRWLTQDFCDGTLTRVTTGAVAVRDLAQRRTVVVRAGHSYFARS